MVRHEVFGQSVVYMEGMLELYNLGGMSWKQGTSESDAAPTTRVCNAGVCMQTAPPPQLRSWNSISPVHLDYRWVFELFASRKLLNCLSLEYFFKGKGRFKNK